MVEARGLRAVGLVICAGHLINVLPDGSLLDSTADQFGEGMSVRLLRPRQVAYGRYRPEFDEDFNPKLYPNDTAGFSWNGECDHVRQNAMRAQHGDGWWLADKTAYLAYLEHQVALGGIVYRPWVQALRKER